MSLPGVHALVPLLLGLPAPAVLLAAFAVPALESSAFLGFVFPGELALLLAGGLASQGVVPLAAVLALGVVGAVVGDAVGYLVGRRFGPALLTSRAGRLVRPAHRERAEDLLRRRGVVAVVLGRFTAALRVLVPGLAGMAGMPLRRFLAANVVGAVGWVALVVLIGFAVGTSWQHAAHLLTLVGLGVAVVWVAVLVAPSRHARV